MHNLLKEGLKMKRDLYRDELEKLKKLMNGVKNTPFSIFAKVQTLAVMNMRYEKIAFNKNLKEHPYILTKTLLEETCLFFNTLMDISFIESDKNNIDVFKSENLIEKHEELWQEIWSRHNDEEFQEFIEMKAKRLDINDIVKYIENKVCVDFGCGNGVFSFAMIERGAAGVYGLDFGEKSVKYAQNVAIKRGLLDRAVFKVGDVTDSKLEPNRFDFAVSNGVFHHLREEDMIKAIKEVARVLKKDGWFWYYIDGKDAISMDLWDNSVSILKRIDIMMIENVLKQMNIKRNKMVHLMDGLSATYYHSTWNGTIKMLSECGFGNFRRLTGGGPYDFDQDAIDADPYGKEKFGEGDLRILCQLQKK
jgi:SAM-dependent methyltransferase